MNIKLKAIANYVLRKFPDNGARLKNVYREIVVLRQRGRFRIKQVIQKESVPDPETIYWINPARIVFHTNYCKNKDIKKFKIQDVARIEQHNFADRVFEQPKNKGKVFGGNWDVSEFKFTDLEAYKAIEQRVNEGTAWEGTVFYKSIVAKIKSGEILWGCTSEAEFRNRCDYIDELILSIKNNGFKLNSQIHLKGEDPRNLAKNKKTSMEILVNIGRNGEYLFQDGRHRLSIAKVLKLDSVPVKVLVRHCEWQELREMLKNLTKTDDSGSGRGLLNQVLPHPDLQNYPVIHGCEDRFATMVKYIKGLDGGNVLDVGANFGFFCHKYEELGYTCYAVELQKDIAWAADKIRIGADKKFQVINHDVLELFRNPHYENMNFNIVNALNIFHHFLKSEDKHAQFRQWLHKLNVEQMFFEAHKYDEPQMKDAYVNYKDEEFVEFLLDNTSLKYSEFIYQAQDGRKVYSLYK